MQNKVYAMLGLASRAGKCCFGNDAVERAVRSGRAKLVVTDKMLSAASKKAYISMCSYYDVQLIDMDDPCQAAGKPGRMVLAVLEEGFAARIVTEFNRIGAEGKDDGEHRKNENQ